VTRAVVGPNKINNVVQFNDTDVTFSSDKEFNSVLNERASAYNAGLTADTNYYAIGERPTVANKIYNGTTLMVTNDFEDDYNVAAAEKTDINYSSISNSNVNDQYYVIDIATEKVDARAKMNNKDAVAVVIFEDLMKENTVGGNGAKTVLLANIGTPVDVPLPTIPYSNVIPSSLSLRYSPASADRSIEVLGEARTYVDSATLVELSNGTTSVRVKFKAGAIAGKYIVEGETKNNGSFSVVINLVETMPVEKSDIYVDNSMKTMGDVVVPTTDHDTPITVPMKKADGTVATKSDVLVAITDAAGNDAKANFTIANVSEGISIVPSDTDLEGTYTVTIKDAAGKQVDAFTLTYSVAAGALELIGGDVQGSVFKGSKTLKILLKDAKEAKKVQAGDAVEITVGSNVYLSSVASVDGNVVTINLEENANTDAIGVKFLATDKHNGATVESAKIKILEAVLEGFGIPEDGDGIQVPSDAQDEVVGTPAEAATITGTRVENSSEDEVDVVVSGSFPNVSEEHKNDHFDGFSAPGETKGEKILLLLNLPSPNGESADFIIIPNGHKQSNGRFRDKYLTGTITDHDEIAAAVGLEAADLYFGGYADGDNSDCLYLSYLIDRASGKGSVELIWVIDGVQIPVTYNIDASGMTMAAPTGA
ncbi:MAG: hypothetical protein HFH27_09765, partial [Clostridiaceae bacterium]|nr:hypothetical protein [Clostridiaceae bacterium]